MHPELFACAAKSLLIHEGKSRHMYLDSLNIPTIGCGVRIDGGGEGLSDEAITMDLTIKVKELYFRLGQRFDWFNGLSEIRSIVITNLAYNIGINGVSKFKKMIAAIEKKDWSEAANQLKDSKWFNQVGKRGEDLVYAMFVGKFPDGFFDRSVQIIN